MVPPPSLNPAPPACVVVADTLVPPRLNPVLGLVAAIPLNVVPTAPAVDGVAVAVETPPNLKPVPAFCAGALVVPPRVGAVPGFGTAKPANVVLVACAPLVVDASETALNENPFVAPVPGAPNIIPGWEPRVVLVEAKLGAAVAVELAELPKLNDGFATDVVAPLNNVVVPPVFGADFC